MLEFADAAGACVRCSRCRPGWTNGTSAQPQQRLHLAWVPTWRFVEDSTHLRARRQPQRRIATLAGPNEIIISAACGSSARLGETTIEDLGICHLEAVRDPVHAFRVGPPVRVGDARASTRATSSLRPRIAVLPWERRARRCRQ